MATIQQRLIDEAVAIDARFDTVEGRVSATETAQADASALIGAKVQNVSSRSEMAGLAAGIVAYFDGSFWSVDTSDLSAEVAADTLQGVYIAPSSDTTGASGAWVRADKVIYADTYGAAGDDTTDDASAFAGAGTGDRQVSLAANKTYKIASATEMGNSVIRGQSMWNSKLHLSEASAALTFTRDASYPYGGGIEQAQIVMDAAAPAITATTWKFTVRDVRVSGGSQQLYLKDPALEARIDNFRSTGAADCAIYTDVSGGGHIATAIDIAPLSWSIRYNGPTKGHLSHSWLESAAGIANQGHIKVDGGAHHISDFNQHSLTSTSLDSHINLPNGKLTSIGDRFDASRFYAFNSATLLGTYPYNASLVVGSRLNDAGAQGVLNSSGTDEWMFGACYIVQLTGNWKAGYDTLFTHATAQAYGINGCRIRSNANTIDQYVTDGNAWGLLNSRISHFFGSKAQIRLTNSNYFDSQSSTQNTINSEVAVGNYCSAASVKANVRRVFSGNYLVPGAAVTLSGGCRIGANYGFANENAGTGTIASGSTSVVIAHGIDSGLTIKPGDITITPTASTTNDPGNWWVTAIDTTTFTLNIRNDPGATGFKFGWKVAVTTA